MAAKNGDQATLDTEINTAIPNSNIEHMRTLTNNEDCTGSADGVEFGDCGPDNSGCLAITGKGKRRSYFMLTSDTKKLFTWN